MASAASPRHSSAGASSADDSDGALVVLLLGLVLSILCGAGIYLVWTAPAILADAACHVALATGLLKVSRQRWREGWAGGVFRRTWPAFLVVLVGILVFGVAIQGACGPGNTFPQVYRQCQRHYR